MSEAPKTVWLDPEAREFFYQLGADDETSDLAQYVRADIHAAAVDRAVKAEGNARLCLSCGRSAPASHDRGQPGPDCPAPDACTFDLTLDEAWQHWREKAHKERARAEKAEVERDRLRIVSGNLLDVLKGAHIDFYHHCDADDFYAARAALRNKEEKDDG